MEEVRRIEVAVGVSRGGCSGGGAGGGGGGGRRLVFIIGVG